MRFNSMFVFDLDGTMDLTDPKLSAKILKMSKKGTIFVTATGRTNDYVIETCKKYGIMPPRYIIGDNGGTIYDNIDKKYIMKTTLPVEVRRNIIEQFIEKGGVPEEIRYTDGDHVFAATTKDVKQYYENDPTITHIEVKELTHSCLQQEIEMTKITLAGSRKLMKDIEKFIKDSGIHCWTDIGATKFPHRTRKNYRLDITDGETSKGKAVEFLSKHTGIRDFTCIGNGPNDFSMFKYALDSGMPVTVVKSEQKNESNELIKEVQEYSKKIGLERNVTIAEFPINGYLDSLLDKNIAKNTKQNFRDGIKAKATPRVDTRRKGSSNVSVRAIYR